MIEERYLKMAINIRQTYLKLINNLDLYRTRALQVSDKLEETIQKLNTLQSDVSKTSTDITEKQVFDRLLKILDEVEQEGKRLENLVNPINVEIEKLSKEEEELYRQIVEHHHNLTEDQIITSVRDRLIKEGLS